MIEGTQSKTRHEREEAKAHEVAIEMIRIQDINDAYNKVEKGEVRFRYVIDMASLKEEMGE